MNSPSTAPADYTVIAPTLTGTVKWFNNKAGFGFITVCCDCEYKNKDIFVHYSSIRVSNSQYKYLVQGEYVNFTLVKANHNTHEFQAMDVSGIGGGPIMCEAKVAYHGGAGFAPPPPPPPPPSLHRRVHDVVTPFADGGRRRRSTEGYHSDIVPQTQHRPPRLQTQPHDQHQQQHNEDNLGFVRVQKRRPRAPTGPASKTYPTIV